MKTKEKSQSKENNEPKLFENRELSWLSFNERVLEEAEAEENPLGEKLNFLSIFESNLDEFFMVRVGSLYDRMLLNDFDTENKTYLRPSEQIELIAKRVKKLAKRHAKAYAQVMEALEKENIKLVDFDHMEKKEAQYMQLHFQNEVLPLLSPVVVTKNNPLPFLENGDLYVASVLSKKGDKDKLGIIPCSGKALNRFVEVPGHKGVFYLTEELILHFLPMVYKAYTISDRAVIRITRNADIDADYVYDEELDYRELMESLINSRKRLSPVRLEYSRKIEKKTIDKLCELLELNPVQAFLTERPLDLKFLSNIRNALSDRAELFYEKKTPQRSAMIDDRLPVIPQIRKNDVLLYYPYERVNPMIQLLEEAARDPETVSIEMTLYRLAKNSQIVAALCRAVEAGKKVTVLVELKARFDEENNIHWTHLLEDAGCEVFYGLNGYKVHSKLLLIKRKVAGKTEYITQIGTGNYNENTARLYTDFCYMTAKKSIGKDAEKVFRSLWAGDFVRDTEKLLVAPKELQDGIIALIDGEIEKAKAGKPCYIGMKINAMSDKDIMKKLQEASKAGVKIDLIIRGINCLISQVPGVTENIRVYSIVGRFLEHARIYLFGVGDEEKVYISSADMMSRNTVRRVEVATPIEDAPLRAKIHHVFDLQLQDNVKVRVQNSEGIYVKRKPQDGEEVRNSQEQMLQEMIEAIQ